MFSLQNLDQITFHINVDVTVAVEGSAAFGVAGESGYEVRILDQFVDVADEGAASHMAAGHFIDRHFGFCSGNGVQFGHKIGYPCLLQYGLDIVVVFLRRDERKKFGLVVVLILFNDGPRRKGKNLVEG